MPRAGPCCGQPGRATSRPAPGRTARAGTAGRSAGSARRRSRHPSRTRNRAPARPSIRSRTSAADANGSPHRRHCRLLAAGAGVLVEADAELRRPLEDVEQLAERQIQQREDDRHRVEDGEEVVGVALHPGVAGREHQSGDADGEQQDERQDVFAELLQRHGAVIDHPPAKREHDAGDHQERRPDESMEDHEGDERLDVKVLHRETEHVRCDRRQADRERSRNGSSPRPAGT